jgi:hypothetical protein
MNRLNSFADGPVALHRVCRMNALVGSRDTMADMAAITLPTRRNWTAKILNELVQFPNYPSAAVASQFCVVGNAIHTASRYEAV